jgi:hypothetical protein
MSRTNEILAITYSVRHHTGYGCPKYSPRALRNRRKKWQSRKIQIRRMTGRK